MGLPMRVVNTADMNYFRLMMLIVAIAAFLGLVIRYAVLSGGAYWYFWKKNAERFAPKRIQKRLPPKARLDSEVKWSLATFAVFAVSAAALIPVIRGGHSKMYFSVSEHGWPYFIGTVALLLVLHDAYFYFAHRLMHLPSVFKYVHRIHHQSTNPSPLAAFSFHPLEALVEGGFAFGMIFIFPIHLGALAIFIITSHLLNILGHLGYEFYPAAWNHKFPASLLNSSTHHNLHHSRFQGNYGLYFTYWDKLFGTEIAMETSPRLSAVKKLPVHVREFREEFRKTRLSGRFYSGWLHLAFTSTVGVSVVTYSVVHLSRVSWVEVSVVPLTFLYANLVEYWGHRLPMHNRTRFLGLIFERHTEEHHRFYTHDAMEIADSRDLGIVLFPPVMIIFFFGLFAVPVALVLRHFATINVAYLFLATSMAYFINYEWFHFAYHLPKNSWTRKLPFMSTFSRLHTSHHNPRLMSHHNFNITWPISDRLFGTYRVNPSEEASAAESRTSSPAPSARSSLDSVAPRESATSR